MHTRSARAWLVLALILMAATALRLWYVLELPGQGKDLLYSDMQAYDYSGWQMAQGLPVVGEPGFNGYHPLSASTYYYPGYTYFVAGVYSIFGHEPIAVRVTQALLGSASVLLVYLIGATVFSRAAGLVAAALLALYLPLVYYAGLILSESWFIFLQMTSLFLWLKAWSLLPGDIAGTKTTTRPRGGSLAGALVVALVAGFVAGAACLSRAAFLAGAAALVLGGLAWPLEKAVSRSRRVVLAVLFCMGAACAIAPITVRNYQIHKRFILISTNGPSTFYTGRVIRRGALPKDLPKGITDAEMASLHRAQSLAYISKHWPTYLAELPESYESIWLSDEFWPAVTILLSMERIYDVTRFSRMKFIVDMTHGPLNANLTHFPDLMRYSDRIMWLLLGLPLAILAPLFRSKQHERWSVLLLALVPYLIIPLIAPPFGRYRMPAVPLVFILAGHTLVTCWTFRRNQRQADALGGKASASDQLDQAPSGA